MHPTDTPMFTPKGDDYTVVLDALYAFGYEEMLAGRYDALPDEVWENWTHGEQDSFVQGGMDAANDHDDNNDDGDSGDFADGEWLASAGMGTDEDYGYYGGGED